MRGGCTSALIEQLAAAIRQSGQLEMGKKEKTLFFAPDKLVSRSTSVSCQPTSWPDCQLDAAIGSAGDR
jgi:hypothetical protein